MMGERLDIFIRRRLRALHMTQSDLALHAGISRQALVKILGGEVRDPRISTVIGLARALQTAPFELLRAWLASSGERGALLYDETHGDRISFVGRENWPNGLIVAPGAHIEKRWTVQNTGDEVWTGRQMRCLTVSNASDPGLLPDAAIVELPTIAIGAHHEFAMGFTCPDIPGLFGSYWKMTHPNGSFCFPELPPLDCVVTVVAF
jgi:transcriptional regulator with XRE-family HTH domain